MKILVILLAALLSGCTYRSFKDGNATYTSIGLFSNQAIAPFSLKAGVSGQPGYRELESRGITSSPDPQFMEALLSAYNAGKKSSMP